jgi:PAS domain S-box-containing protein
MCPLESDPQDGAPDGLAAGPSAQRERPGAELSEREAAWERGREFVRRRDAGEPLAERSNGLAGGEIAGHAFAALAENVRDYAIFLMDTEGIIVHWGEGARLIKWWSREEAEGSHLRLLYPDGGSEDGTAEDHLRAAAERGEYTGEGHRMRSDGSTFWAMVTLTALRDPEGTLRGFAKVTRDLTAERAAEAARKAALADAEEANRLKGMFLATMSHEIRTPLNSVMAYTDLLDMELAGPLTDEQRKQIRKIRSSSQHLLGIIEDVLDLSRIEAGRLTVARDRVQLGGVIWQALAMVEPQAARRRVELVDAVSAAAAEHWCLGDEERVRQIVLNLLSNAVKFTDAGGQITVSAGTAATPPDGVRLEGEGPWVFIRVEDTGRGIPPERIEAVFEPFSQADMKLTRQHGGAGLGLSISRQLARLLDGDLTARSQVGLGSTFFLWLPAATAENAGAAGDTERAPEASTGTLRAISDAILAELERILHAYVARLRTDPGTPGAANLSEVELEDHLASFLSDLAQTTAAMDLAEGSESPALQDGTAIRRTISERHGSQRARLGWSEDEVRREFEILGEELDAAIRRRVRRPREAELDEVIGVLEEALERAKRISLEGYRAEGVG